MKKIIFYCLTASVLLFTSCEKEKLSSSQQIPYHKFYSSLDFIKLPVNRYFIYKDSATGSVDSVRVTYSIIEKIFQPKYWVWESDYNYDYYRLTLIKIGATNENWLDGSAKPNKAANIQNANDPDFFFYSDNQLGAFWYPFTSSVLNMYTYIPTLTIEGTTYTAVHSFSSSNGLPPTDINYHASVFYWVKGIGIIKKESRAYNSVKTSLLLRYG